MPSFTPMTATSDVEQDRTSAVAQLNDQVRLGHDRKARIVFTRGIAELLGGGETTQQRRIARTIVNQALLLRQIALAPIEPGDDPYGERDFGAITFMPCTSPLPSNSPVSIFPVSRSVRPRSTRPISRSETPSSRRWTRSGPNSSPWS